MRFVPGRLIYNIGNKTAKDANDRDRRHSRGSPPKRKRRLWIAAEPLGLEVLVELTRLSIRFELEAGGQSAERLPRLTRRVELIGESTQ